VPRGQRDESLWPYSRLSRPEPLLVLKVAPQLYSRGLVDPYMPNAQCLYFFMFLASEILKIYIYRKHTVLRLCTYLGPRIVDTAQCLNTSYPHDVSGIGSVPYSKLLDFVLLNKLLY
jgi:hypothetical protein